jgi:hypothetical protein
MSKSLLPWSLKGVSLEARSRAKTAAGEAGEPLGKWLSDTIRRMAEADVAKTASPAAAPPPAPAGARSMMIDPDTLVPEAPTAGDGFGGARSALSAVPDKPAGLSIPSGSIPSGLPPPLHAPASPLKSAAADPNPDWRVAYDRLTLRVEESERTLIAAVERVLARLEDDKPRPQRRRRWRWPFIRG